MNHTVIKSKKNQHHYTSEKPKQNKNKNPARIHFSYFFLLLTPHNQPKQPPKKMLDFTAEVEIAPGIFLSKPIKNSASSSSTAAAAAAVPESSFRPVSSNAALRLWKEFQQQAADTSSLAVLEQDLEDERNSVKKLLESNQVCIGNLMGKTTCTLFLTHYSLHIQLGNAVV